MQANLVCMVSRQTSHLGIAWVSQVVALMRRRLPLVSGGKRISVLRASSEGDARWPELGSVSFFVCGL